jgi:hypothetical protein
MLLITHDTWKNTAENVIARQEGDFLIDPVKVDYADVAQPNCFNCVLFLST